MTVREFDGSDDQLVCATGAASGMTHGTTAAIIRVSSFAANRAVCHQHNSGGTFLASSMYVTSGGLLAMFSGSELSSSLTLSTSIWYLVLIRKATGTATPRYSMFNYNTAGWTHAAGGGTQPNWTAPGASGTFQFSFQAGTDDRFAGRVAVRALWANTLPWAADSGGDTALEAAGLEDAAQNWADENPSAFWLFNQASVGTPVEDVSTTGTADQTSITGTTAIEGADPAGFDFTLGGPPPELSFVRPVQAPSVW